jgi:hypothetical protein
MLDWNSEDIEIQYGAVEIVEDITVKARRRKAHTFDEGLLDYYAVSVANDE